MAKVSEMLADLVAPRKALTKWEEQFVESVSDQFDRNGSLTPKQIETLEKIHEEKA